VTTATRSQPREPTPQRSVALTAELISKLDERAELEERSASAIVRMALRAYLDRELEQR